MHIDGLQKKHVGIIGIGCAAMSLASQAHHLARHVITLIAPSDAPPDRDHIWGFWATKYCKTATQLARHKWNSWIIETPEGKATMYSKNQPYCAIHRKTWISYCKSRSQAYGVKSIEEKDFKPNSYDQILDSRPPLVPAEQMVQHFIGWEIITPIETFVSDTAILMDFRCDQSRGIHFIYLLPFSPTRALVESTMFSTKREPDSFFEDAIQKYLEFVYETTDFSVSRVEKGAIPLGRLPEKNFPYIGIGGNGGAIRPSSGYAFSFILKQVAVTVKHAKFLAEKNQNQSDLIFCSPHKYIDLLMDEIFLTVLRFQPDVAPSLFLHMSIGLAGSEFAMFMNGEATWRLRLKVISVMPKWVFIQAFFAFICTKLYKFRSDFGK